MVISWGLGLWVVYFFIGESATLKLCTTAETGAGLKYICFNTSLKITSGKKAHETHWIVNRRGGNYVFFFRDAAIPARSWPTLRSMSSLIGYEWHHPLGQSSSHPDDVISAKACQWRNAGRALQEARHFLFHFSLLVLFGTSFFPDQNCRDFKKPFKNLLFSSSQIAYRCTHKPKRQWMALEKLLKKWGEMTEAALLLLLILSVSYSSN